MHFDSSSLSIKGIYHGDNQDFIRMDEKSGIFIVADGMGGAPAGALASKTAVTVFHSNLTQIDRQDRLESNYLKNALVASHEEIKKLVEKKKKRSGMGTTLSALVFNGDDAKIVHIGDSVILRFRNSVLEQLTEEHTVASELIKQGYLDAEGIENHPLNHVLSKCVGPFPDVQPDIFDLDLQTEDIYMLGSDGLLKLMTMEEIQDILNSSGDAPAKRLVEHMKQLISSREFVDDCTFGLVRQII